MPCLPPSSEEIKRLADVLDDAVTAMEHVETLVGVGMLDSPLCGVRYVRDALWRHDED